MSDQSSEKEKTESPKVASAEASACPVERKGWLRGPLAMAVCCGAPLLLVVAISLFGVSLGAIASGFLSLAAVLACPLGMYLMMRMMMNNRK